LRLLDAIILHTQGEVALGHRSRFFGDKQLLGDTAGPPDTIDPVAPFVSYC